MDTPISFPAGHRFGSIHASDNAFVINGDVVNGNFLLPGGQATSDAARQKGEHKRMS